MKGVALSAEYFIAKSYRDGKCATLQIKNGDKISFNIEKNTIEKTGTYIEFKPSQEVYNLEEIKINFDEIKEMCENWAYLNKGLKFNLENLETKEKLTYFSKNGVADFVSKKIKTPTLQKEPFLYNLEDNEGNKVEIAFQWGSKKESSYIFTNGLHNVNGGTSLTGAKTGITRTINNLAGQTYSGDFIRDNLCYVVNAKVPHASFSDQTKTRVNTPALKPITDRAFSEAIKDFSVKRKDDFERIVAYLNKVEKASEAAERARNAVLQHEVEMTQAKKQKIIDSNKLRDAKKLGKDSILLCVEGLSAGGSMSIGRSKAENGDKIGILMLRGKCINALSNPIEEVLQNEEVKLLLQALGLTYGKKYNSSKLRYGKIAISSDSDSDGSHIGLLVMAILQKLAPEIIQENRLYWLRAPIYKVENGKKTSFYYSEEEFKNHEKGNIIKYKGLGQMNEKDLRDSLFSTEWQHLEQIVTSEEGLTTLLELMGEDVSPRKEFVQKIDFGGFDL